MQSQYQRQTDSLVAFGANVGDCEAALCKTVDLLKSTPKISGLVCSDAVTTKAITGSDSSSQNEYLNAAIRFETTLSAADLHMKLVDFEKQLGREREERWGPRTVDLDLLLFGDTQQSEEDLTIPHPRMSFRRFVLEPAAKIAADMVHPVSGMTIEQLLDHIDSTEPKVVVVTNDLDFAGSVAGELSQVQIVEKTEEFLGMATDARMVVSMFRESGNESEGQLLSRFASNFAGPTLRIDQNVAKEEVATELRAAIDAMQ